MSATQSELEIQSITVDAISPTISQQAAFQQLSETFKIKLPAQPDPYTRHKENLRILEKFFNVSREKKGGNEGVFFSSSSPSKTDLSEVEERVKKMATRLATVSLREWMLSNVDGPLEKKWGDCETSVEQSFKGFAKLILNAYDLEDLERFNSRDKLWAEYKRFYDENLSHLKSYENPYKLVAQGKINFDGFPLLREQDVGYLLEWYGHQVAKGKAQSDFIVLDALKRFGFHNSSLCFEEICHGRFIEIARTVLLDYVKLEEDIKMHTNLDGLVCDCAGPLKGFIRDFFNVVGIRELEMDKIDDSIFSIYVDLNSVARERLVMLDSSHYPAAGFVNYESSSTYSSYDADEVSCLIRIADARRRFKNRCFISKHHILWAAAKFTIYKELVYNLVEELELRILDEGPLARRPPYSVYISAQTIAEYHGAKLVGVEHIVVAVVYEICKVGRHKKDLEEFNSRESIRAFLYAARDFKERFGGSSIFRINTELLGYENIEVRLMGSLPETKIPVDHIHILRRAIWYYDFIGPLNEGILRGSV